MPMELMYLKNGDISIFVPGDEDTDQAFQGIMSSEKVLWQVPQTTFSLESGYTIKHFLSMLEKYPLYTNFSSDIKGIIYDIDNLVKEDITTSKYQLHMHKGYGVWESLGNIFSPYIFVDAIRLPVVPGKAKAGAFTDIVDVHDILNAQLIIHEDILYTDDPNNGTIKSKVSTITPLEFVMQILYVLELWARENMRSLVGKSGIDAGVVRTLKLVK